MLAKTLKWKANNRNDSDRLRWQQELTHINSICIIDLKKKKRGEERGRRPELRHRANRPESGCLASSRRFLSQERIFFRPFVCNLHSVFDVGLTEYFAGSIARPSARQMASFKKIAKGTVSSRGNYVCLILAISKNRVRSKWILGEKLDDKEPTFSVFLVGNKWEKLTQVVEISSQKFHRAPESSFEKRHRFAPHRSQLLGNYSAGVFDRKVRP